MWINSMLIEFEIVEIDQPINNFFGLSTNWLSDWSWLVLELAQIYQSAQVILTSLRMFSLN